MSERPAAIRDDGLQSERTRLAWRRTTLAMTVVCVLAARLALIHRSPLGAAAALFGWLAMLWVTHRRIRALASSHPPVAGRTMPLLTITILGYAVLGAILVISR